ncbi:7535_t:CDS:1, partial [Paraglomus brasilianum]
HAYDRNQLLAFFQSYREEYPLTTLILYFQTATTIDVWLSQS